ncbi:MAG TPA: protoporphyrinogen oxidase HemJ [Pseudolabrys sp.]|jgi:putative membrane protein|nr:protoporphyrinogen oxidase HemJ [Pseudolabrys sp.]
MLYLWLKAFHIIAVIAWMAGMLYLPRLFVYHASAKPGSEQWETFTTMEQRLLRYIMTPAMAATWLLGMILVLQGGFLGATWFHIKFALVVAMTITHGLFSSWAHDFAHDRNLRSAKFYRIANEIPTLILIAIVILATVKPFG